MQGRFGKGKAVWRLRLLGAAQPSPCRRLLPGSSSESFISLLLWFKPTKFAPSQKILQAKYAWKKLVLVELRHSIPAACQSSLFPGFLIIFLLKPL